MGYSPWGFKELNMIERLTHTQDLNITFRTSLVAQRVKNLPAKRRPGFNSWVGKIPWRGAWQPTPVFLPGESPWTEKSGGLQSMGSQRVKDD